MAIIQGLLALLARSAGKLINTAFGWATVMLFGRVSEERQIYLSMLAFGSVAWLIVLLGIAFPAFGVFLLTFVPLPDWVDRTWIRWAMLAAAVIIPLIVGLISVKMLDPEDRPRGAERVKAVLKGYPYTAGLALTLVMMTVFAPVFKVQTLARRWTTQHVPMIVEAEDYLSVVEELEQALAQRGWETERTPTSWMLRAPTHVLTFLAGGAIEDMVAENLTTLRSQRLEVVLHPSDLVISGPEADVAHARATVAEQLAFSRAHMTWTKEANALEDRLGDVWEALQAGGDDYRSAEALRTLHGIEQELRVETISYEEWEVLFRQKLLVERGVLQIAAGLQPGPEEPATSPETASAGVRSDHQSPAPGAPLAGAARR